MKIPFYHIDAFTNQAFKGNPAGVCLLDDWLDAVVMQQIATENNLSETAFVVRQGDLHEIRWFSPAVEIDLCGHATLAAGFVLVNFTGCNADQLTFMSPISGELKVLREADRLTLDFPARPAASCETPALLIEGLKSRPKEVLKAEDYLAVYESAADLVNMAPDFALLKKLDCRGVIVTAPGDGCDFVSRFFAPALGIDEDPATGSSHCTLTPYWKKVLGKDNLHALQLSPRGGELFCMDKGERIMISGQAVCYLEGSISI